jgi:hypothetical protein
MMQGSLSLYSLSFNSQQKAQLFTVSLGKSMGISRKLKILSEQGPSKIFKLALGAVRTRQATWAKNLVPKFARTDQRKFSFSVRTVDIWNRLPDEIKQAVNQEDFRKDLRTKILEFQRKREQNKDSIKGTPVSLLR